MWNGNQVESRPGSKREAWIRPSLVVFIPARQQGSSWELALVTKIQGGRDLHLASWLPSGICRPSLGSNALYLQGKHFQRWFSLGQIAERKKKKLPKSQFTNQTHARLKHTKISQYSKATLKLWLNRLKRNMLGTEGRNREFGKLNSLLHILLLWLNSFSLPFFEPFLCLLCSWDE